jgi:signal transduction histidine kinase
VRLNFEGDTVRLQVEDNGRGLPAAPANGRGGETGGRAAWGLLGMQERAELLGGHFEITSHVGQGTRVTVTIPAVAEGSE